MEARNPHSTSPARPEDEQGRANAEFVNPDQREGAAGVASETCEASAMPSWMAAMKARRSSEVSNEPTQPPPRPTRRRWIVPADVTDESLPLSARVKRWLHSYDAKGFLASAMIHAVLLIGLFWGIWLLELIGVIKFSDGQFGLVVNATLRDDEFDADETASFDVVDSSLDVEDANPLDLASETLFEPTELGMTPIRPTLAENLNGLLDGDGRDPGTAGFLKPRGANAITKGSFTAWTEPENPPPKQFYRIVIEIKLPEGPRRYNLKDLSGSVLGTDGFELDIGAARKSLRIKDRVAQVLIPVPGALTPKIKEAIVVQSQILNERQTIEFEF